MARKKIGKTLTEKQNKYLIARVEGNSKEASKRIAGYASTHVDMDKSVEHLLLMAMESSGITPHLISDKLMQGFSATKVDRQGFEHPDYDVRLKYIRTVLEMLGLNKTLKVDVSVEHKDSGMNKEELKKLITEGSADALQQYLAEQSVIDAEEANYKEVK